MGEAEGDLLRIRYDPTQITPKALLEAIGKQELQGKIVLGDS